MAARPVGAAARLLRACRRRPLVALLLSLLAFSLFGGLAGVTWKWLEAGNEKREAQFQAYRARIAAAIAALSMHDVADARRNSKTKQSRRNCGAGNGGTCTAGSTTARR